MTETETEADIYFHSLKELLESQSDKFPVDELGDLYLLAINFCIRRYNSGDAQFLKDGFEIYQNGLQRGIFLNNNTLSQFTYRNIVTLGLIQDSYEWVESFIHEYKEFFGNST